MTPFFSYADEIEVIQAGRRRPVLLFEHVRESGEGVSEPEPEVLMAEVSTNDAPSRRNLYVLAFDERHLSPMMAERAVASAGRFLAREVRPGDAIAIAILPSGGLLPFTTDTARAQAALQEVRGRGSMVGGPLEPLGLFEAYQILRGDVAPGRDDQERITDGFGRIDRSSDDRGNMSLPRPPAHRDRRRRRSCHVVSRGFEVVPR